MSYIFIFMLVLAFKEQTPYNGIGQWQIRCYIHSFRSGYIYPFRGRGERESNAYTMVEPFTSIAKWKKVKK